jgi:peptidoglycan/LPS O-acetylase OafA/YrhL
MQFVLPERVETQPKKPTDIMWIGLIVLGMLPSCIALARLGARVIPAKPLLILSNASFAMYLLHRLTYRPLLKLYDPQQVPHILLYSYLVLVPLTFLLAIGIQNAYDGTLNRLFPVPRRA